MKRNLIGTLSLVVMAVMMNAAAHAQTVATAKVPFAFKVGSAQLPVDFPPCSRPILPGGDPQRRRQPSDATPNLETGEELAEGNEARWRTTTRHRRSHDRSQLSGLPSESRSRSWALRLFRFLTEVAGASRRRMPALAEVASVP